jgi:hypothetical protein
MHMDVRVPREGRMPGAADAHGCASAAGGQDARSGLSSSHQAFAPVRIGWRVVNEWEGKGGVVPRLSSRRGNRNGINS